MSLARIGPGAARQLFVGDDAVGGAVGVADLELGQQRQPVAVDVARRPPSKAQPAAIPAIAEHRAESVAAFAQQVRSHRRSGSAGGGCSWSSPGSSTWSPTASPLIWAS